MYEKDKLKVLKKSIINTSIFSFESVKIYIKISSNKYKNYSIEKEKIHNLQTNAGSTVQETTTTKNKIKRNKSKPITLGSLFTTLNNPTTKSKNNTVYTNVVITHFYYTKLTHLI
jgi:glucan-binding YG repeat protein